MYQGNFFKYEKRRNEFSDYQLNEEINLRFLIQKITFLIKL